MDLAPHRQSVARALGALEASLARLVAALAHEEIAVQMEPDPAGSDAIRRAGEAYSAIDYHMEDRAGESVICLGVIGVGSSILRQAEAVNAAKAELKAICSPLQRVYIRVPTKGATSSTQPIPAIRGVLRNIQRSDLNLLAAYRKIPLLSATPASVTYTRANTRAVYRKSIEAIDELLLNLGGPTALADRRRLATLDRRETHVALVKERYQNIRANVVYAHLDPRGRGRIQITAELPLLYPKGRRGEPPEVRFPSPVDAQATPRIRQTKLEPRPFLESLPVYRYARPSPR
jgi:hypothetical protein